VAALVTIAAVLAVILVIVTSQWNQHDYTFADEFNGSAGVAPDPAKWTHDLGGGGWGNNELQTYTNSRKNSFLDGQGNLVIRATQQHDGYYNSARLTTADSFAQRHGHWEARIKINSQPGLWPAWWMLGDNFSTVGWPRSGEVDMAEDYGFSAIESSVHTRTDVQPAVRTYAGGIGNDSEFHVFSMDWTPAGITFSRDGEQYAQHLWNTPNGPTEPSRPMFMLLNLAVGGKVGNPPPNAAFPVEFVVDYVRVWE